MFKIAVCDDIPEELAALTELLSEFVATHREFHVAIRSFTSAPALISHVEERGGFDLYLLDILMPGISGLTLGEWINARREDCEIVYLTSSRDYAIQAFGLNARGYLLKPYTQSELFDLLIRILSILQQDRRQSIVRKTDRGIRKILMHEICYVENVKNYQYIHLKGSEILRVYGKLSSLFEELRGEPCFIMPRHSYIVNFEYIEAITKKEIIMEGGDRIPLIRNSFTKFSAVYLNYMFERHTSFS